MSGKGSKPRPIKISYEDYGKRFDDIFRNKNSKRNNYNINTYDKDKKNKQEGQY